MAFEGLTDKLQNAFRKLSSKGKLTEADVKTAMREVRMALLEADVNYLVVKDFVRKVTERAVGADILASLTPGQQVIKIVNEELTELMGGQNARLTYSPQAPTIYMLCGLQGAGKTTMAGKLGLMIKKGGKKPLLVACDVYRPAAIKQLQVVGEQAGVEVFERGQGDPVQIAKEAVEYARYYGRDPVIIDTAGRLHIDENLMQELRDGQAPGDPAGGGRHDRSGRGDGGQDVQRRAGRGRRDSHQAGRRYPRRRGHLGARGDGQADQVLRRGRKAHRSRALPSRPHGQPNPRHGRRAVADRKGSGHLR